MDTESPSFSSLLQGIADPHADSFWREFDRRYRPVVLAAIRRVGLGDADAADVAQDTFVEFLRLQPSGRYDPSKGPIRYWLSGIARRQALNCKRRLTRRLVVRGRFARAKATDDDCADRPCFAEQQESSIQHAIAELRSRTRISARSVDAFELVVIRGVPACQVAAQLGMHVQDVYASKARVADRLRRLIKSQATDRRPGHDAG